MKKIIFVSAALAVSLNAATNEEILGLYSGAPKDIKIEITDRKAVDGLDGFEAVVLKMSQGDMSQEDIAFTKDNLFIPDLVNIKTGMSYKDQIRQTRVYSLLADVYPKEEAKNIIKLGNDAKKPTLVVFTDAECPYCRKEMEKAEDRLKTHNLEIVMTSVHGESGNVKSALIYKETAKAKSDDEKLKVLHKYYNMTEKGDKSKVSDAEFKAAEDLAKKYQSNGINGVPFIVEKDKISK